MEQSMKRLTTAAVTAAFAAALALTLACGGDGRAVAQAGPAAAAPASKGAAPASTSKPEAARAAFDTLINQLTTEWFQDNPESATQWGVTQAVAGGPFNGRLNKTGLAARAKSANLVKSMIARLQGVDPAPLDDDRKLTRSVLIDELGAAVATADAAGGYGRTTPGSYTVIYPITQLSGSAVDLPMFLEGSQPVANAQDAADYVSRLRAFGGVFDGVIEEIKHDGDQGVVPPDFAMQKAIGVVDAFLAAPPKDNPLYGTLVEKLDKLDPRLPDAETYKAQALDAVQTVVYPAYERLGAALRKLAPKASHDAGIWRLPNGAAVYQALIFMNADSKLTGEQIHQIGLDEVARIHAEMDTILKAQGMKEGTVAERMTQLRKDPRFLYPNTDEGRAKLLADLNAKLARVQGLLPTWFATIPGQPVEVRRIPVFSEATAAGGYANFPPVDGSRPGIYWINLRDTATLPSYSLPTLTYHEGVPGHLFQGGIAVTRTNSPIFRTMFAGTNAFVEGWALYSEHLAKEMGLYDDDPWGDLGRLQDELHRAIRLVTDTGMHAMHWSREEALAYMLENEGYEPKEAEAEIERYAAWPAQALGYKMGMLKILELRERAKKALGDKFDIRKFHDAVLLDGGLPLPVLEERVNAWIEAQKGP
jgi:uncharacterized protein (DUF885 family)